MSSLISMIELATKTFIDFGFKRRKAVLLVGVIGFIFGIPSAVSISFFSNQDWVWGVGLIFSGAFIAFAVNKFGVDKLRREIINGEGSDIKLGKWYNVLIGYIVPILAVTLIVWWLYSSVSWDPEWWNPFHAENVGTCLLQWGIVLALFIGLNKFIVKKINSL
jgi:NSS family neurotransmitter:Na+ symporter